ncbi:hypothetical protein PFISCL1PPCAC_21211, partial [Pristionchus fissidentatus]
CFRSLLNFIMALRKRSAGDSSGGAETGVIVWSIDNFDTQPDATINRYSPEIEFEEMPWKLLARFEKRDNVDYLGAYLVAMKSESNLWSVDVSAEIKLINQDDDQQSISQKYEKTFNRDVLPWGFVKFVEWSMVTNPAKGFIKDDKITVEARFTLKNMKGIRKIPRLDFTDSAESFHDVTLIVAGKKLHVNKTYLALHSPVFKTMFFGDFVEKNKKEIEIKDVDFEEFSELLNVIYPSYQKITDDNVEFLLSLEDRFEIKMVIDQAESFLISSTEFIVPAKLKIADQYRLVKLQDYCLSTFTTINEITTLKNTAEYKELSDASKAAR